MDGCLNKWGGIGSHVDVVRRLRCMRVHGMMHTCMGEQIVAMRVLLCARACSLIHTCVCMCVCVLPSTNADRHTLTHSPRVLLAPPRSLSARCNPQTRVAAEIHHRDVCEFVSLGDHPAAFVVEVRQNACQEQHTAWHSTMTESVDQRRQAFMISTSSCPNRKQRNRSVMKVWKDGEAPRARP